MRIQQTFVVVYFFSDTSVLSCRWQTKTLLTTGISTPYPKHLQLTTKNPVPLVKISWALNGGRIIKSDDSVRWRQEVFSRSSLGSYTIEVVNDLETEVLFNNLLRQHRDLQSRNFFPRLVINNRDTSRHYSTSPSLYQRLEPTKVDERDVSVWISGPKSPVTSNEPKKTLESFSAILKW